MDTYKSTNTLNGKFYIGSTTNFENRKRSHLRSKENYPFQNALRKNPEAFVWEVWSDDSDEPILEQALLDTWYGKEQCYNLNPYADRGPDRTGKKQPEGWGEKHSKKLKGRKRPDQSIRMTENNPATRPEVRRKIGDGNRGKVRTQETKDKISETLTGTSWGEHTEDHKEKMSSLHSGEGNPAYGKKHWVNAAGDRKFQQESPGPEWQNGMKWKTD
jgi:group I intron endonuclease